MPGRLLIRRVENLISNMRIVSLISAGTEMLFALGLGEQVVAVSHECDWPPECRKLPRAAVRM